MTRSARLSKRKSYLGACTKAIVAPEPSEPEPEPEPEVDAEPEAQAEPEPEPVVEEPEPVPAPESDATEGDAEAAPEAAPRIRAPDRHRDQAKCHEQYGNIANKLELRQVAGTQGLRQSEARLFVQHAGGDRTTTDG